MQKNHKGVLLAVGALLGAGQVARAQNEALPNLISPEAKNNLADARLWAGIAAPAIIRSGGQQLRSFTRNAAAMWRSRILTSMF